jgi:hypothetical protein
VITIDNPLPAAEEVKMADPVSSHACVRVRTLQSLSGRGEGSYEVE